MRNKPFLTFFFLILFLGLALWCFSILSDLVSPKLSIQSAYFSGSLNRNGRFEVVSKQTGWHYGGKIPAAINYLRRQDGADAIGVYSQINFNSGSIRVYVNKPVVLFDAVYIKSSPNTNSFPTLSTYPIVPYHLTYQGQMAEAKFNLDGQQSPWVFFDDKNNTAILSPASHFLIAATHKDWTGKIVAGIDPKISTIPQGFDQKTILVESVGLNQTLDLWGKTLTDLQGKIRPANDSDVTLNTLGYWTDNGAAYYYHFDPKIGNYPETLLAVKNEYQQKNVPIKYMQLDSWWYGPKDKDQGILLYEPDPAVWKDKSLKQFQNALGLPTAEHARWIGANSPYFKDFQMSQGVSIDPAWWADRMSFLKNTAKSVLFEQDWLYNQAKTKFNLNDPEKFMDEMAKATSANELVMQYCLAQPQHFLQGSKYDNLSTIRVSQDSFEQSKWENEMWASKLAASLGIWPWVDVFKSRDQANLLLANLSAGLVGPGDELGKVDAENLRLVVRGDSTIVKPDAPLVPIDRMYFESAKGQNRTPFIATTYTDFGKTKVYYLTVFSRPFAFDQPFSVRPSDLGASGQVYIYDFYHKTGRVLKADDQFTQVSPKNTLSYFIVVPLSQRGVAFLGDQGKFVSLGKKRVSDLVVDSKIEAEITFAGEDTVTLFGYSPETPKVTSTVGSIEKVNYDPQTKIFTIPVHPGKNNTAKINVE